jgi:hypothetical protein
MRDPHNDCYEEHDYLCPISFITYVSYEYTTCILRAKKSKQGFYNKQTVKRASSSEMTADLYQIMQRCNPGSNLYPLVWRLSITGFDTYTVNKSFLAVTVGT